MSAPSFRTGPVRVRVPATSANLGPAFDSAGLALSLHDEVEVSVAPGVDVEVTGEGAGNLSLGEGHLVVQALRAAFDLMGGQPAGVRLRCTNRIPHARGLGSSSAAIVAGVVAARALVVDGVERLDDDGLLTLADELEGHPDNVAACLRGGVTLAWRDAAGVHAARRDAHPDLVPVVWVPSDMSSTALVRGLLPAQVPHVDAAHNAGRAALLAWALTDEPGLALVATDDRLHQTYRSAAMPRTAALVAALRASGVAAVVSGAGPTVLAITVRDQVDALVASAAPGWAVAALPVDAKGAVVLS